MNQAVQNFDFIADHDHSLSRGPLYSRVAWSKASLRMTSNKMLDFQKIITREYDALLEEIACDAIRLRLTLPSNSEHSEVIVAASNAGTRYPSEVASLMCASRGDDRSEITSPHQPDEDVMLSHGEVSVLISATDGRVMFAAPPGMMPWMNPLYDAFGATLLCIEWDTKNGGSILRVDDRGMIDNIDLGLARAGA